MNVSIDVIHVGQAMIVECRGDLDTSTQGALLRRIQEAIVPGCHYLLLDLSSLDFADSTALEALESVYRITREEGVALEIQAGKAIRRIIDLLGPPYIS